MTCAISMKPVIWQLLAREHWVHMWKHNYAPTALPLGIILNPSNIRAWVAGSRRGHQVNSRWAMGESNHYSLAEQLKRRLEELRSQPCPPLLQDLIFVS